MNLTGPFYLESKSKEELKALYRDLFNYLANPNLTRVERNKACRLMLRIEQTLSL